uniref:Sulfotransferase family protein n=1 Tax=Moorena producens (strain JHB) TaxID=1454205 RepID=A0A1D9FVM8_MOOP1
MISHEHKCIFVHIPKCAGTSIEHLLGHFDDFSGRGGQDHRSIRTIEQPFIKIIMSKNYSKPNMNT